MSITEMLPSSPASATVSHLLDDVHDRLVSGAVHAAMDDLFAGLRRHRSRLGAEDWKAAIRNECLSHRVADEIFRDPMSRHSFERPRGYPGDADLLDYLYGIRSFEAGGDECSLGRQIHGYLFDATAARAVRARRRILAETVDRCASEVEQPRILSIAAGHLREADLSGAVREYRIGEYMAFDQDARSLARIEADYGSFGITTIHGSVRGILAGRHHFTELDLVYASGLYDYLRPATAARLTGRMFQMLRPGGRLLVANFVPTIPDAGFMESYMGWDLIYRDRFDLVGMTAEIPEADVCEMRVFGEENRALLFLEVRRR